MEINETALATALLDLHGLKTEPYGHMPEYRTFKTSLGRGRGEEFWTYTVEGGEVSEVREVSYFEYCDLNDECPDFG